jgi:metal-dependent amidase/aminoacylase/carboxypeptidase family protein
MKRLLILLASVFVLPLVMLQAGCQYNANNTSQPSRSSASASDAIRLQTDGVFEKLVGIRRDLHEHPELAGNETRTSAVIAARLREMGLEVQTGHYGHSVVGILRGGHPGKTIAWRAELDALPGDFADPVLFKSRTAGVHHACGHDIHIAIALGIAEILVKHRQSLHGTAVFIFQPEEETFKGAKALIERGVFSSITPDEIYGVHVTALPVGQIVVRANEMFAYQRRVSIRLKNELSKVEIQQLTKRVHGALSHARPGAKPWEIQNIVDPVIGVTSPSTAFQDYLIMAEAFDARTENGELILEADMYETSASNLGSIISRVERAIDASGHKSQLLSVSYVQENPTVQNDPTLTRLAIRTLQRTVGVDAVRTAYGQAPFFNDDFAYFQQKIPGVYFFLGGSNFEKGIIAMNHAPNFQVDEESIRVGVRSFSSLLIARLGAAGEAERD